MGLLQSHGRYRGGDGSARLRQVQPTASVQAGPDHEPAWPACPTVVAASWPQVAAALSAAVAGGAGVTIVSPAGAAEALGIGFWDSLVRLASTAYPGADAQFVLDCGAAPGLAVAALRLGHRRLILRPDGPSFASVIAIASQQGAILHATPPASSLDLTRLRDPSAACRALFAAPVRDAAPDHAAPH